jgi:transcriptional regulator with XRE-family HTH domain
MLTAVTAADLIRSVRTRRGLTQVELARRAGTTQTAISRLERGARSPTVETLRRLLLVMGEDLDLRSRGLTGTHDPKHLRAERALTPAKRLERAFAWMRFNAAIGAAGRRARRLKPKAQISPDPRRIFAVLARRQVDYVVIGGIAVIAHGHTRNTRDVDLMAAGTRADLERLAAAFRDLGARLSGVDAHLLEIDVYDPATLASGASFTLETDAGGVDYFGVVPGAAPYEDLRERALLVELEGLRIRVVGIDDLIRMKQASGRPQDLSDIAALTADRRGHE